MTEDMLTHEFHLVDLMMDYCLKVTKGVDHVFNLAADMGGMGFIQSNHSVIMYNNTMISFNTIEAARINGVKRDTDMSGGVPFFYRCVCTKREHDEA
ncbi:UNVERIFIED_CONTAM: GDP-mannose 3,5-epimerase 1 [Sesamum radiatum]|uniref:GDP-mannose 3,5-epimerase 1 n=1 Tax=Sesamum radiatum TaxID=300843 RepID=A0AAW2JVR0_SESRA